MSELPGGLRYGVLGDKSLEFYKDAVGFVNKHIEQYQSRVFLTRFLLKPTVIVASGAATKELLYEKNDCFHMGYKDYFYHLFGDLTLFMNGTEAKTAQSIIRPLMCPHSLQTHFHCVESITVQWLASLNTRNPISIYTQFKLLATQISLALFLGIDQNASQELMEEIVNLTMIHWHGIISVPLNMKVPLFKSSSYKKALEAKEKLLAIIYQQLESCTSGFISEISSEEGTINNLYINHLLLAVSALVPKALASLLTSFVTSSHHWQKEMVDSKGNISEEDLNCILLEVERCWPPFIGGRRIAKKDCELSGYKIPEGYAVLYVAVLAHKDPSIFPNPEAFFPERWKTCNAEDQDKLFCFGGGPRCCTARHITDRILKYVCSKFLEHFHWEVTDGRNSARKWFPVARHKQAPMVQLYPRSADR